MIRVLQSLDEVDAATRSLEMQGLPTHITIQKNWDQQLLQQMLAEIPRTSAIIDLGCGDCCTLNFLSALGYTNLHGIDLQIKSSTSSQPYQLYEGDLMATPFPDMHFDVAVSISVIEHGVNLQAFFQEAYRLLKSGGLLFVTTDYWEETISVEATIRPFGLDWKIFSEADVEEAIALAHQQGFILENTLENTTIPPCNEKTVSWYDKHYTFIALTFKKP